MNKLLTTLAAVVFAASAGIAGAQAPGKGEMKAAPGSPAAAPATPATPARPPRRRRPKRQKARARQPTRSQRRAKAKRDSERRKPRKPRPRKPRSQRKAKDDDERRRRATGDHEVSSVGGTQYRARQGRRPCLVFWRRLRLLRCCLQIAGEPNEKNGMAALCDRSLACARSRRPPRAPPKRSIRRRPIRWIVPLPAGRDRRHHHAPRRAEALRSARPAGRRRQPARAASSPSAARSWPRRRPTATPSARSSRRTSSIRSC